MRPLAPSPEIAETHELARLDSMKRRIEVRRKYYNDKIDRIIRQDVSIRNLGGEELRLWLEKFAVGKGVDICCGNFLIGDSIGVDSAYDVMGNSYNFRGDNLASFEENSLDHVVCNYFDCFDSPLKALNEWKRVLKPGGVVAFCCSNADCYDELDCMLNGKRQFLYTPHTMNLYMSKLSFRNYKVQTHKAGLLVYGTK